MPEVEATVGVLVLANFGSARDLRIDGVPVFPAVGDGLDPRRPAGSCIAVVATDAPLQPAQLERLARRAGLGLARTGSVAHHGSGEIFVAFSTAAGERDDSPPTRLARPSVPDGHLDALFSAVVEATEEAVLNALWAAVDTTGREGRVVRALPHEPVLELLRRHGRLGRLVGSAPALRPDAGTSPLQPPRPDDAPDEPDARRHRRPRTRRTRAGAAQTCGHRCESTPTMDEPTSPPRTTSATAIRLTAWSMWYVEVVEAGVADLDLEPPLPRLLHHVADLVRQLARDARELAHLGLGAQRHPPR